MFYLQELNIQKDGSGFSIYVEGYFPQELPQGGTQKAPVSLTIPVQDLPENTRSLDDWQSWVLSWLSQRVEQR